MHIFLSVLVGLANLFQTHNLLASKTRRTDPVEVTGHVLGLGINTLIILALLNVL